MPFPKNSYRKIDVGAMLLKLQNNRNKISFLFCNFIHDRDIMLRRVNYGNETHVNVTISVMDDNRAGLFVSLDKKNR